MFLQLLAACLVLNSVDAYPLSETEKSQIIKQLQLQCVFDESDFNELHQIRVQDKKSGLFNKTNYPYAYLYNLLAENKWFDKNITKKTLPATTEEESMELTRSIS